MTAEPTATTPGPLALVGSGEYLPAMLEVERALIAARPPRYVQIPTAAAPEGAESLDRWAALGAEQAQRLGVQAIELRVVDRATAEDPTLAGQVAGAGLVYLSGGNPPYCASTLRGSAVWTAVRQAWRDGAALAGCSAGAMALTGWVPDLRHPMTAADPGLGVVPLLRVIPHFDRLTSWMPDLVTRFLARSPHDVTVLGIDETTALVWREGSWTVYGEQAVHVLTGRGGTRYEAGAELSLADPTP